MRDRWTQDNSFPCWAERQQILQRAELILAQARLLRERLDRAGGMFTMVLQAEAEASESLSSGVIRASGLQTSHRQM